MKNLNLLMLFYFICFIFSCKEDKENLVQPIQDNEDYKPKITFGPHYDEKNSNLLTWEQLPAELLNAIPLDKVNTKPNGRTEIVIYSFLYGPFGTPTGPLPAPITRFDFFPPFDSKIHAIAISSGSSINKLVVWYKKSDGTIYSSSAGGTSGTFNVQFFSDDEYIYYISGRSSTQVNRLSFFTNKKSFSYGGNGGSLFYAEVPSGYQHLGFWGITSSKILSIGFYVYSR